MKKFIKKMIKKTEGFTLVELIVVIAILGILAAVAVPAYSGYLTKAKEAGDIVELDAIKTAVQAYSAEYGAPTAIEVTTDSDGKVTAITVDGVNYDRDNSVSDDADTDVFGQSEFALFMTGTAGSAINITLESDTFKGGAKWPNAQGEWYK